MWGSKWNFKRKIPNGFITILDNDLKVISTVWKSRWKFICSLLELENRNILATTFNGINTTIIKIDNYMYWKKIIE